MRNLLQERVHLPSNALRGRSNFSDTTTATEIACLLRISERSAHRLVQYSALLVTHHPKTLAALRTGAISWAHATTLLHYRQSAPEP